MLEKLMLAQAQVLAGLGGVGMRACVCVGENARGGGRARLALVRGLPAAGWLRRRSPRLRAHLCTRPRHRHRQECVLEKSIGDKKTPAVVARLAKQAAQFYRECAALLTAPPLNQHFDRSWLAHATVKALLYDVEATVQVRLWGAVCNCGVLRR